MPEQTMIERVARVIRPRAFLPCWNDTYGGEIRAEAFAEAPAAIAAPFEAADETDWVRLFASLDDSGHGKFWKRIFTEIRALSQSTTHTTKER